MTGIQTKDGIYLEKPSIAQNELHHMMQAFHFDPYATCGHGSQQYMAADLVAVQFPFDDDGDNKEQREPVTCLYDFQMQTIC